MKNESYRKVKNLFLRQSYLDCWEDYQRSLRKSEYIVWDYVILTASNREQAEAYKLELSDRQERKLLPPRTKYVVLPDPDGKRVGSGGAALNALKYIAEQDGAARRDYFAGRRVLILHSGGDSKRVPQYSASGKLFSPVPRELPNGRPSTLFDELIIAMSGMAGRIPEGVLVLSGDVLLLFNPLQIDCQFHGAAAISTKTEVSVGTEHGVFLNDGANCVERFLHKQSEEQLRAAGAVNEQDLVDLDTGAVIMDVRLTNALFGLISTDGWVDDAKFAEFVNDRARISFYGDFLYPLARQSTLEGYYKEKPEGSFCEELLNCRTKIWDALHDFELSLISLSPAEFIHFGTTWELRELMTRGVDDYEFLGWRRQSAAGCHAEGSFAAYNSLIGKDVVIGSGAYIENCVIDGSTVVGEGSILSNLRLAGVTVPADVVLHSLQLKDGQCVVRVYGVLDNPKGAYEQNTAFLGGTLRELMDRNQISPEELWGNQERYLWSADLYPVCADTEEAVTWALLLCRMARGEGSQEDVAAWKRQKRMSLYSSFNQADIRAMLPWRRQLEDRITVQRFVDQIAEGIYYKDALAVFGSGGISREQYSLLMEQSEKNSFSTRIRIYYDVSRYMKHTGSVFAGVCYDQLENRCFQEIQRAICESGKLPSLRGCRIGKDEAAVALPVRVNWGGGWTDTPPYCLERGGTVINASITLNGIYPVQVSIRKIDRLHVEFESADVKVSGAAESVEEIRDCRNPYDFFSLHKAALIATGIISDAETRSLQEILRDLGGGFRLSTQVVGVPKGSGLGTSSILAAACIKAIFAFVGCELADNDLYNLVLCMEQIMSTGGGWQDQVGGVVPGIKFITTKPGINQQFKVEPVILEDSTMRELQERFALIYTGQRRLARNLLRDVVGGYIGSRKEALEALDRLHQIAALIRFELERGSIDRFAQLLNEHWMLSQQLDSGSTNTCIDQIFLVCEDLIDGRFITGAGGGGFLQVILKKGVTKERLQARLYGIFQDSGVAVWDAEIV